MKLILYPERTAWPALLQRPVFEAKALEKTVRKILSRVKKQGDKAVKKFTQEFDGAKIRQLLVSPQEIDEAANRISPALKQAILTAKNNIEAFHKAQQQAGEKIETMPGVSCWRKAVAIESAGLYIPGGTAPLFSTVLMLGIPARIAGCREVVVCTPPQADGSIHPAILFAAQQTGVTKIIKAGGVQAIAAMAYGTKSVPAVNKLFGPGNQYVNAAKQLVQAEGVAIDMPAGPSEVCVLADETAEPSFIAADLLSQAEHGPDSQVVLVSTSRDLLEQTQLALSRQLDLLPRAATAMRALENSKLVLVQSLEDAIDLVNAYAPEHLLVCCRNDEAIAEQVINAGSVFLGNYSPESVGDYASGTNHALPTNGYAKSYSGVSVDSFVKKITYQRLTQEGLKAIGPAVITMAEAEGLQAHANAVSIRLKKINAI